MAVDTMVRALDRAVDGRFASALVPEHESALQVMETPAIRLQEYRNDVFVVLANRSLEGFPAIVRHDVRHLCEMGLPEIGP
jgi:hypothetical protein